MSPTLKEISEEYFRTMPKPPGDRKYPCHDVNTARLIGFKEGFDSGASHMREKMLGLLRNEEPDNYSLQSWVQWLSAELDKEK